MRFSDNITVYTTTTNEYGESVEATPRTVRCSILKRNLSFEERKESEHKRCDVKIAVPRYEAVVNEILESNTVVFELDGIRLEPTVTTLLGSPGKHAEIELVKVK